MDKQIYTRMKFFSLPAPHAITEYLPLCLEEAKTLFPSMMEVITFCCIGFNKVYPRETMTCFRRSNICSHIYHVILW